VPTDAEFGGRAQHGQVVTANVSEFSRVRGLAWQDWAIRRPNRSVVERTIGNDPHHHFPVALINGELLRTHILKGNRDALPVR